MKTVTAPATYKLTVGEIEAALLAKHYQYRIVTNGFSYKIQRSEKKTNIFGGAWGAYKDLGSYDTEEEMFVETIYRDFPSTIKDLENIKKNDTEFLKRAAGPWEEIPT